MKLYEVSAAVQQVQAMLADGEIDEAAAADTVESLLPVAEEKGRAIAALVQNHQAEIAAMKEAEERIAKRRKQAQKSIDWFLTYLRDNMVALGIQEISCPEYVAKLVKNPPSVVVEVEPEELPDEFLTTKVTVTPDKAALKDALKSGREVRGVKLVQTQRVKFK
jgi:hypothetical protein